MTTARAAKLVRWLGTIAASRIRCIDAASHEELGQWAWPSIEPAELADEACESCDLLAETRQEPIRWRLVAERDGAPAGASVVSASRPTAPDGALGAMLTDRGREAGTPARQAEAAYRLLLQGQAGVVRMLTAQLDRSAAQVVAAERRSELAESRLRDVLADEIALTEARSGAAMKERFLAELLPLGKLLLAGKTGVPDDAVAGWLRSLTPDQLHTVLPVLTPVQLAGLQTMLDRSRAAAPPEPS